MGKTLFITGASSGIGAATARAAAEAGWNVGLFARSEEKLTELAKEIGPQALVLVGDATDIEQQRRALDELRAHTGSIDAVFANAGRGGATAGVAEGDPQDWDGMIDLNIKGALYTAQIAMEDLKKCKGHYIVTGSVAGRRHIKGSIYSATKWLIHGFAGNLADEMTEWGGRCTVIAPGMVDTAFFDTPKPDKLQPKDIAEAVVYALEAPARADVREICIMPTG